ncbi:MAG TPA: SRPBCC domain-containing protein [Flavobacteriales bacterium]|nr:SRPBCC domain-containing protein [Flavobacteriales bacterium]
MSHLAKYTLEFPINSSVNILYNRLSTSSGLSEWFADDVIINDKIFTFFWDGSSQKAKLLKLKMNRFIRFKWEENNTKEDYFEFLIQVDEMTSDVSLMITDFAEDKQDQKEQTELWSKQISILKRAIGS